MDMLQVPLLGNRTNEQIADDALKALAGEAAAAECYSRLIEMAPDAAQAETLRSIYRNEMTHYSYFERLYRMLARRRPKYAAAPVAFLTYREGLMKALNDELDAAAFYRNVQLSTTHPIVKEVFYLPMVDEITHAIRLNALLNT